MIAFLQKHPEKIIQPFTEHLQIVLIALLFSVAVAVLLTMLSVKYQKIGYLLLQIFAVVYSIPSLALFALLIPVTGLGLKTAIVVLVLYNQYLLLRNFLVGVNEVPPAIREAAKGIGMTTMQVLWRIQVPLAKKSLFAGIRLAVISTVGIGTIAASINAGGLGALLFDGLRTMNMVKVLWGSILSAGLAIGLNAVLKLVEEDRKKSNVAKHD